MKGEGQKTISPRISILVAVARNGVIGSKGGLPWHLPADLKRFKELTMGHHLVMGRKTYESIGRLLPGRTTVIVTSQADYEVPSAIIAHSLDEAIAACKGDSEIFVIGGGEIFREVLPLADRIYATEIHAEFEGDVFFPEWNKNEWKEIERTHYQGGLAYDVVVYEASRSSNGLSAAPSSI
ncbi:MAG: dihydrofolate reductase [Burkholderiales bacterium]